MFYACVFSTASVQQHVVDRVCIDMYNIVAWNSWGWERWCSD